VLAPFRGEPLIVHVLRALEGIVPSVVATSTDRSDNPLVAYLDTIGVPVFRGPLDDVFERFRLCARANPCVWILRVSADSPLLDRELLEHVVEAADESADIVTTVFPRTVRHGHSAELIRVETLLGVDGGELTPEDREHVTPFFYRHADRFRILSVDGGSDPNDPPLVVDTVEDLRRLEEGA
jgi:spore coat polysaccharide biosynthesis protein SpsF